MSNRFDILDTPLEGLKLIQRKPMLDFEETLDWTVEWYKGLKTGQQGRDLTLRDIERYLSCLK